MHKPYSESCEQNKVVILEAIEDYLAAAETLLEIGSGTGQHAVYFAGKLPQLVWQTSDLAENLPAISAWIEDARLTNLPDPIELDVADDWVSRKYDLIFSANCFHIMDQAQVDLCIQRAGSTLNSAGHLIVYGPFNYRGSYTSESNRQFDGWLKARDPRSGIKHFETLDATAENNELRLVDDIAMPANNRILIWQREPF